MHNYSEHFDPINDDNDDNGEGLSDLSQTEQEALQDELEELLADRITLAPPAVDDLDALLSESMAAHTQIVQGRAAKERLRRGGQSEAERREDAARVAAWEAAHEWQAVASVALFHDAVCLCGASTRGFQGLFTRELHRHLRGTQRWRRVEAVQAFLPSEVAIRGVQVPMCGACAFDKGWDISKAYTWEAR